MNLHSGAFPVSTQEARTETRTGPRIYNLFPLLVGTVSAWRAELPRIARMNFDWVYVNPFHESGFSGSLYAIKDPSRLDPRFRDPGGVSDDAQIEGFVADAAGHGLKVMTDLVINHTSKDAALAKKLTANHPGQSVLVAGHSNTLPGILEALGVEKAVKIGHEDHDNLFVVVLEPGRRPHVITLKY